jgi:hypothetical protein
MQEVEVGDVPKLYRVELFLQRSLSTYLYPDLEGSYHIGT